MLNQLGMHKVAKEKTRTTALKAPPTSGAALLPERSTTSGNATMATAKYTKEDFDFVRLDRLVESAHNPRQSFDQPALNELAASIRSKGVLQPLVVRRQKGKDDEYEIVCGARRFRAAKLAGIESVPVIIRHITDKEALEIQVIENVQRSDVHPLEEGLGYKQLIELHDYDVAGIALKTGKSESYVYARMKLCDLSNEARAKFESGEINASIAVLLSRLSEEEQMRTLDNFRYGGLTVSQVKTFIKDRLYLRVIQAPFSLDEPFDHAPPCTFCQKRTSASKSLFADYADDDLCTDAVCWNQKRRIHVDKVIAELNEKGVEVIRLTNQWASKENGAILGRSRFSEVGMRPDRPPTPKGMDRMCFEAGWGTRVDEGDLDEMIEACREEEFDEKAIRAGYAAAEKALATRPSAIEIAEREGCQLGILEDGELVAIRVHARNQEDLESQRRNSESQRKKQREAKRESAFRKQLRDAVAEQITKIEKVELAHIRTALQETRKLSAGAPDHEMLMLLLERGFEEECKCSEWHTPKLKLLSKYAEGFGLNVKAMRKKFAKGWPEVKEKKGKK